MTNGWHYIRSRTLVLRARRVLGLAGADPLARLG